MIDIFFWALEGVFWFFPYLMIKTGEIVLAALSLGFHRPRQNKNLDITDEDDSLITIQSPAFWVGIMFWICIGIYLSFYLSGG